MTYVGCAIWDSAASDPTLTLIECCDRSDDEKAAIQGTRLDEQDAPRDEAARQKQLRDDRRAASDKARVANKAVFRP